MKFLGTALLITTFLDGALAKPVTKCTQYQDCMTTTIEQVSPECGDTGCSFKVCYTLSNVGDGGNCDKKAGGTFSHTCDNASGNNLMEQCNAAEMANKPDWKYIGSNIEGFSACQYVEAGGYAYFTAKDGSGCADEFSSSLVIGGHSSSAGYTCQESDNLGVTGDLCSGNNGSGPNECVFSVGPMPDCENVVTSTPDSTPDPTPETTPKPTAVTTAEPNSASSARVGSAFGDPHIKTWSGQLYDFHGACDLVLMQNLDFHGSLGMRIHMRTQFTRHWSYISAAVVQIGDETLEVVGGKQEESYYLNKVVNADLNRGLKGFAIEYHQVSSKQREFIIDLGNNGESIHLRTWGDFVRVDFIHPTPATFGNSLGLLGRFGEGSKIARDGATVVEDNNEFGMEWQVRADEPMLFHSAEGSVQAPEHCALPDITKARRRRLLRESTLTQQDAEVACSRVSGSAEYDACVFDVLATNDKDMAGAY